ncbi:MAG: hypothetical protein JXA10_04985 [Anaerolineae bacterium]|nr:hypothetical protein [Anaerolineae bacterium]
MTTTLRAVLTMFETTREPISLAHMARDLDIPVGMLEGMIQHWIRKGKIREAGSAASCGTTLCSSAGCGSCSSAKSCGGYAPNMPKSYELVRDDDPVLTVPMCHSCGK